MILIDGNNLAFRYKTLPYSNFTNNKNEPTGVIYAVLMACVRLANKFQDNRVLLCWDSIHNLRKSFAQYKGNRNSRNNTIVYHQMTTLQHIAPLFGVHSLQVFGYEADDIANTLYVRRSKYSSQNTFVSDDQDWLQFVKPEHHCYVYRCKHLVTSSLRYNYAVYHSIVGSRKDNIFGIKRFSHNIAKQLARSHNDIEDVIKKQSMNDERLYSERRLLRHNFNLLKLRVIPTKQINESIKLPTWSDNMVKYLCQYFQFKDIFKLMKPIFGD